MRIVSIILLDRNYRQISQTQIDIDMGEKEAHTISSFISGINTFGTSEFEGNLRRIDFNDLWFDFLKFENYFVILIIKIEPTKLMEENEKYNKYISDLHAYISNTVNQNKFDFNNLREVERFNSLVKVYLSLFRHKRLEVILNPNNGSSFEWEVEMAIVCDQSGIPFLDCIYTDKQHSDPIIISSILSTFFNFANVEFNKKIERIFLDDSTIYFKPSAQFLYVVVINNLSQNKKVISEIVEKKIHRLLNTMGDTIEIMYEMEDDDSEIDTIREVIDEYIREIVE